MKTMLRILGVGTVATLSLFIAVWLHLPDSTELRARALTAPYASEVFDRNGKYIGIVPIQGSPHGPYTRLTVVPDSLVGDLVAIEGMVPLGFSPRAFLRAVLTGQGGGSTISQQVYRTITGDNERTIRRKFVEMIGAVKLSLSFTRQEILELYLNQVHWTHSKYSGIAIAARRLFDKRPERLERGEWLVLIAALPSPSVRGDYDAQSLEKIRAPYLARLDLLVEKNRMTKQERQTLQALPLPNPPKPREVDLFMRRVSFRLDALGANSAPRAMEIRTTIDLDVQEAVRQQLGDVDAGRPTFVMVNRQQEVLSYYVGSHSPGGLDYLQQPSLPSSRMKVPVFAARAEQAVEENGLTASGILNMRFPGTFTLSDKVVRDGVKSATFQEALVHSYNAPAYQAMKDYGPDRFVSFARQLGIEVPPYLAVALGTEGISEVDLTAAYSALLLRGGRPAPTSYIMEVYCRRTGAVLYSKDGVDVSGYKLVTEPTILALRQALRAAAFTGTSKGLTARAKDNTLWRMNNLYAKTGTSQNSSDYRYLGVTTVFGGYAASLTIQGKSIGASAYSSGVVIPAARRVLNSICRTNGIACARAQEAHGL